MRILIINTVCGIGSTGRIATELAEKFIAEGHECVIAYGRADAPEEFRGISHRIGSDGTVKWNALKARIFDNEALNAKNQTKKFLKWANSYNPDMLWLHNLHGYYINIELLLGWIKSRPGMQVKWTLHDCWAFTGHCAHFSYVKCDRWKTGCHHCPQTRRYPAGLLVDSSKSNYRRKKEAFQGVNNMTLITPSRWLAELVRESFLGAYPTEVHHNRIDTGVFLPTESDFREKYGLENRKILLGVATAWDDRKGLDDFVALSRRLQEPWRIVLVGLTEKQMKKMPPNVLCLPRTNSRQELARIYTAADVFLNPSKEETFGLTTLEALSCGTFPIVYKGTACQEVAEHYGGMAVEQNLEAVMAALSRFEAEK